MKKSIVIFASDHAGLDLKKILIRFVGNEGYPVIDVGSDKSKKDDDYPIFAREGAKAVRNTKGSLGIFVCGSGVGMSIVANRMKGIRAFQAESKETATRAKKEDAANVLVLGSRIVSVSLAKQIVRSFLQTPFSRLPRHSRRVKLIDRIA